MRIRILTSTLLGFLITTATSTTIKRANGQMVDRADGPLGGNPPVFQPASIKNAAGVVSKPMENTCDINGKTVPKVFLLTMFKPEGIIWYNYAQEEGSIGDLLAKNVTVPGLSFLYPQVHCLADCSVCQLTTGESEINAATSITALMLSPKFDLTKTYFLIAGIAGVSPEQGTLADVSFAKYVTQVALQYEFDYRDIPSNFSTGYVPQGSQHHTEYPQTLYGTEVFELNEALRDVAIGFAKSAKLLDTAISKEYRARYKAPVPNKYEAATLEPKVRKCDVACSDVYYSGTHLGEAFENYTKLMTNGSGTACMTAQEDNATLEAMIRFAKLKMVDFARIIIMRSAADFDRPYPGLPCISNLFHVNQGAFLSSISNLYLAGTPIIKGILSNWTNRFEKGIAPQNYIGDIFGSLGGTPDFGPSAEWRQRNPVSFFEETTLDGALMQNLTARYAYRRHEMKGLDGAEVARRANGNG